MLSSIRNKRKRGMCYAIIDGSRGQGEYYVCDTSNRENVEKLAIFTKRKVT